MIYENIKKKCSESGISVRKLEEILGFPRSSICKWNDNIPSVTKIKKVADYFGVSIEYFLEDDAS